MRSLGNAGKNRGGEYMATEDLVFGYTLNHKCASPHWNECTENVAIKDIWLKLWFITKKKWIGYTASGWLGPWSLSAGDNFPLMKVSL